MASPCQASARPPPYGLSLGLQPTAPPNTRHAATPPGGFSAAPVEGLRRCAPQPVVGGPARIPVPSGPGDPRPGPLRGPHDSRPRARSGHRSSRPHHRVIAVPAPRETGSSLSPVGLDRRARAARLDACHPLHSPGLQVLFLTLVRLGPDARVRAWGPAAGRSPSLSLTARKAAR